MTDDGDVTPADVTGINQLIVGIWAKSPYRRIRSSLRFREHEGSSRRWIVWDPFTSRIPLAWDDIRG